MKIGIDIRNIGKKRTGDEAVFFSLTKNLAEIDSKNEYKLFTDTNDSPALQYIGENLNIKKKKNFEIISLPAKNRFAWNFWTLPRHLRKNPVDIYLTQYITPWFVPKKIKIATIIHDISFKIFPELIKKSDLLFLNWLIPMSFRRADKIIAVSKFTRNEIIKHYGINPEKIDWMYNAVSQDFLARDVSEEKIKELKEKYGLPEKYILYIGTLQPRKNIPVLVEAIHELLPQDQNFKLVIAGGKGHNHDADIDKQIKKYQLEKEVFMPGFIDEEDKAAIMAGAEIFCFPSLYEGFGIPILEAMSVGTPVIASKIPPHEEIAKNCALFFNPRLSKELSREILEISENKDLKETLRAKGKKLAANFSWAKSARKMLEIFERANQGSD